MPVKPPNTTPVAKHWITVHTAAVLALCNKYVGFELQSGHSVSKGFAITGLECVPHLAMLIRQKGEATLAVLPDHLVPTTHGHFCQVCGKKLVLSGGGCLATFSPAQRQKSQQLKGRKERNHCLGGPPGCSPEDTTSAG